MTKICDGRCRSRGPILIIYNTSLFLFKTNILMFVSSKSVKIYSSYREDKLRTKRISKILANGGLIGMIFGTSCFLVKPYRHTEFHSNRSRTRHSCHTKHINYDQSLAMVTVEVVVRFWSFTIPAYSPSKQTFWFLFHQNRSRFTRVIVRTNFGYRVQVTGYRVQINNHPPKIDWNVFQTLWNP